MILEAVGPYKSMKPEVAIVKRKFNRVWCDLYQHGIADLKEHRGLSNCRSQTRGWSSNYLMLLRIQLVKFDTDCRWGFSSLKGKQERSTFSHLIMNPPVHLIRRR